MKAENTLRAFVCYLLIVPIALVVVAAVWNGWADGVLYHCTDPGLVDLWPPFVHAGTDDIHVVPIWLLNTLWGCLVAVGCLLPAAFMWGLCRIVGPDSDEPSIESNI